MGSCLDRPDARHWDGSSSISFQMSWNMIRVSSSCLKDFFFQKKKKKKEKEKKRNQILTQLTKSTFSHGTVSIHWSNTLLSNPVPDTFIFDPWDFSGDIIVLQTVSVLKYTIQGKVKITYCKWRSIGYALTHIGLRALRVSTRTTAESKAARYGDKSKASGCINRHEASATAPWSAQKLVIP